MIMLGSGGFSVLERDKRYWEKGRQETLALALLAVSVIAAVAVFGTFSSKEGSMPNVFGSMAGETADIRLEEPFPSRTTTASKATTESEVTAVPFKVWIDAGHGGKDPGAKGFSGAFEAAMNLEIATKVYGLLQRDVTFEPRMTRTDDTFVVLEKRPELANAWRADVFISIHGNAYESSGVTGIETLYKYDSSLPLAEAIHGKLVEAMGFKDRGIRQAYLKVLALSRMPAVLIESGYLSNAEEEAVLLSEEGQLRLAEAIVDGLRQYAEQVWSEPGDPMPDVAEKADLDPW